MEIFAGLAIGLVVALIAVIVVMRGKPKAVPVEPVVAPQPTLTAAEIREVIREVHSETLSSIADQSKRDRDEVVEEVLLLLRRRPRFRRQRRRH